VARTTVGVGRPINGSAKAECTVLHRRSRIDCRANQGVTKLRSQPDVDELIGLSIRSRSSSNVERPRGMSQQKQGPVRREADAPQSPAPPQTRHPTTVGHSRPPPDPPDNAPAVPTGSLEASAQVDLTGHLRPAKPTPAVATVDTDLSLVGGSGCRTSVQSPPPARAGSASRRPRRQVMSSRERWTNQ
jgi:hypothetical protein